MAFIRKNFAKGVLASECAQSAATMSLTAGHTLPTDAGTFRIVIWLSSTYSDPSDDPNVEIVTAEYSGTPNIYDITRAQEDTADATHAAGSKVSLNYTAGVSEDDIALDGVLEDLNTLGPCAADSEFLVGTGAGALAWESGATARTSIGLGTADTPTFAGLAVIGGATGASFTRSGSSGVCVASFANIDGTIYFGINANEDFGIGPNLDIGTSPFFTINHTNSNLGINEANPAYPVEMSFAGPVFTLHNTTAGDADDNRVSSILGTGHQSGDEESTLGIISFSHDGAGDNQNGKIRFFTNQGAGTILAAKIDSAGVFSTAGNIQPMTDDTYYLGKNDDDTPFAWKGIILKDQTDGKYYRCELNNGAWTITDLTD